MIILDTNVISELMAASPAEDVERWVQIAAIARAAGADLATRNVGDFEGCGIEVVDPWRA